MRYNYLQIILCLLTISSISYAQQTLYNGNFPDSGGGGFSPEWTNSGTINWTTSSVSPSNGYPGATGGTNAYSGSGTGSAILTLSSNISTVSYTDITVIWGGYRVSGQSPVTLEWRAGSGSWNAVTFTDVNNNSAWNLVNNQTAIHLPAGAEGTTNLQFRWSLTNPVQYRIDDIKIQGTLIVGVPVKLAITSVYNPTSCGLRVDKPFNVVVQSQDINGNPSNVLNNTGIILSKVAGSGDFGGTLSAEITAYSNTATISGVTYNVAETGVIFKVSAFYGTTLTPASSLPLIVGTNPSEIRILGFPATGYKNFVISPFTVIGFHTNGNVDSCFSATVTISQNSPSGNNIHGTLTRTSVNSGAHFNDIYFDANGTYTIKATCPGFPDVISTQIVISDAVPVFTDIFVPEYIQGMNCTNTNRLYYLYFGEFTYLTPNTAYRYFNQVVTAGDPAAFNGAGNVIFINTSGNFYRTANPDLAVSGNYGTFTTDADGKYRGWFITEPTGDARFAPGTQLKMRIMLNDGTGTGIAYRFTTTKTVKVINFGYSSPNGGNPYFSILNTTTLTPKNVILMYTGSSDSLNPYKLLSAAIIEGDGVNVSSLDYFPPYKTVIDEQAKLFGSIIPDNLPLGITMLQERSLGGGLTDNLLRAGDLVSESRAPNGIWPPGVDTKNLQSSTTPLLVQPVFIPIAVTQEGNNIPTGYTLEQNYPNPFNPITKIRFSIPKASNVRLSIYDVLGREVSVLLNEELQAGSYNAELDASRLASGLYFYRLEAGDYSETRKMVLVK